MIVMTSHVLLDVRSSNMKFPAFGYGVYASTVGAVRRNVAATCAVAINNICLFDEKGFCLVDDEIALTALGPLKGVTWLARHYSDDEPDLVAAHKAQQTLIEAKAELQNAVARVAQLGKVLV